MSNSYWSQNQINYAALEDEFNFTAANQPRQQQFQQHLPPGYGSSSPDEYRYQQQQFSVSPSASSLHGAFGMSTNQSLTGTSTSFANGQSGFVQGIYPQQNTLGGVVAAGSMSTPYQTQPASFDFNSDPSRHATLSSSRYIASSSSGQPQQEPILDVQAASSSSHFNRQLLPPSPSDNVGSIQPAPKRPRDSGHTDDQDNEQAAAEHKDSKAKLSRACARCKNLKVRCEAKTETEPCKRCFNGGHECVIPGRKIRKTPPKREHLLNQIQSQAREIERLMRELEQLSAKRDRKLPDQIETKLNSVSLSPPSPSSPLLFDGSETSGIGSGDDFRAPLSPTSASHEGNPETNQALADWIAKAKESLQEFGTFIGIGGATLPKNYLIDSSGDSDTSGDEDYVDVQEHLDDDDRYEVTVERPADDNGDHEMGSVADSIASSGKLRHKSSASSMGTTTSTNTQKRRNQSESAKPANLPVAASPFGLFGDLMLKSPKSRDTSVEPEEKEPYKGPGIANEDFFSATPASNALGRRLEIAQHQWPAILTRGIITPQEAESLFKIYFDNMNISLSLLDPVLYTAPRTLLRSPFLFTVICAIASRFYIERPDLYPQIMRHAQLAAGTALISGNKNVEMCQAYILLSLYPVPSRKWEDQRGWLYLGLAIRTATDLNLHVPTTAKPRNENHAREMLNRTRIWLNCFNLDRSTGSQYGKPPIINPNDYTARQAEHWWCSSPYNMQNFDIHVSAYNSELKLMSNFIAKIYSDPTHPTGLNKEVDFEAIATVTDDQIKALGEKWMQTIYEKTDMSDQQNSFRTGLLRLAYSYSRLIALSYGFQHAFGKDGGKDENPFLQRCLKAASDVVNAVVNDVCRPSQIHYWRHGPEAQSVFVTFASAFLVKLLQPKFASYLSPDTRAEIRRLVQSVIDLLRSPDVAIDDRHGPKLYSRFLEKLLNKVTKEEFASPASSSVPLPPRNHNRSRRTKTTSNSQSASSESNPLDTSQLFNHASPATSHSLSPPPTSESLSFDQFAPVGAIDPFAPGSGIQHELSMNGDFFQPSLPFDPEIMQSFQSLTDPNEWNDVSFPEQFADFGTTWMAQLQQNIEPSRAGGGLYSNPYMTGAV